MRREIDGKAGVTLICHCVGHGNFVNGATEIILNEEERMYCNPFPLEMKLRSISSFKNVCVLGTFNCSRTLLKSLE